LLEKKFVNSLLSILPVKINNKCHQRQRDFSLKSGERQTGTTLAEIRYDHKARYDYAIEYIKNCRLIQHRAFGLDIFCGTGYGTSMIAAELSCNMLGIDGSGEAVAFANRHYAQDGTYYAQKMFPFSLPRKTFDFITCYESLEHVQDDAFLIEQLDTALKVNGLLFLSTPNERCLPLQIDFHKFHYSHYTLQEVVGMINKLGEYHLVTWLGQDLYKLDGGKCTGILADHKMDLHEHEEGQLMIYVFKKMENS
jgi:2-polyprenyl-3-methyl-5-hydroxy-6-metoxy-1,4-benzoquinol methylase